MRAIVAFARDHCKTVTEVLATATWTDIAYYLALNSIEAEEVRQEHAKARGKTRRTM